MSKPIKLWNGRAGILHNWRRPAPFDHAYVAAHSRADAARMLVAAGSPVGPAPPLLIFGPRASTRLNP